MGIPMSKEESVKEDKKRVEKSDYAEVEFEIGDIEFEAAGRSVVVERMFRLLLDKIEAGSLVATLTLPEEENGEEETEEDVLYEEEIEIEESEGTELSSEEEAETKESASDEDIPSEAYLDPPPKWDSLDTSTPPETEPEREVRDI